MQVEYYHYGIQVFELLGELDRLILRQKYKLLNFLIEQDYLQFEEEELIYQFRDLLQLKLLIHLLILHQERDQVHQYWF